MFKYIICVITGGLKTSKAFERAKQAIIDSNYEALLEEAKQSVRRLELERTGLLQSDDYCKNLAKISIAYGRANGEVDEFYNVISDEGGEDV